MFTSEIIEKLGYYVYRLIDPRNGETFYVGKGTGNRVFQHASGIAEGDSDKDQISDKLTRIRAIQLAGFEVAHVIHRHGMESATAYQVEAALMEAYPGTTNIMGGHHSDAFGVMHADELRRRYEAQVAEFRHRVVMLSVGRLAAEESLYEATRYAWKISVSRAQEAQYVLPVVQGVIRGAFVAERWLPATEENFPGKLAMPGRYGFEGRSAPDEIINLYAHKRVPPEFRKKGAVGPVKYAGPG
jgi:hypothetical protein